MVAPCEFCSSRAAVLYCRADSAKLCLSCDQHVHSANALSIKHLRSQICDNCSDAPAAVRCFTDNLFLCHDCDEDAHSAAVGPHERLPAADAFSGCPSPFDLAAAWGLDIVEEQKRVRERRKCEEEEYVWGGGLFEELMVPNGGLDLGIGKQRGVVVKQLLELVAEGGGEEIRPKTASSGGAWNEVEEEEKLGFGGGEFTSLMMQTNTDANTNMGSFRKEESDNLIWNNHNTSDHSAQIWDFNLGQLRGQNESGALELDFGGNDMDYVVKSYGELLKEASGTRRGLDFPGVSCSFAQEEMIPFNGASNNPTGSQGPATSESNNMASSCSGFNRQKGYNCSKDIHFSDESILIKSESAVAMTKADLELLAKNRGNAMQRYKEKKKNRRYDKQIRYESRKARADTRKRVKGRFVKASDPREG